MKPLGLYVCEDSVMLTQAMDDLPDAVRAALVAWLQEHGVNPADLVTGTLIVRDPVNGSLSWQERDVNGVVTKRWRFAGHGAAGWPLPFPSAVIRCVGATPMHLRQVG